VVLLLSKKDQNVYSYFKDLSDRHFSIQSICVTEAGNFLKNKETNKTEWSGKNRLGQYFGNVAMKANLKLGQINHTTELAGLKDVLVLGADVTHPGVGSLEGCPSIAAVVGSVDDTGGKFLGDYRPQPSKEEIIRNFHYYVCRRICAWSRHNDGKLPARVLYYRDGVSSNQYQAVLEQEVNKIPMAFQAYAVVNELSDPLKIKTTAVIVTKRHHTRFYPKEWTDAMDTNDNCFPGTLIDNTVTSPYFRDFFHQTHNAIKGTARPAHYFVVKNEIGVSSNAIQDITQRLCYTYVRATLGVSYASPAYYADRLCERGRCY
ncbi:stem cell self-renewal protein Piwi, partial [Lophiostoma macrostomum CBS 122681]